MSDQIIEILKGIIEDTDDEYWNTANLLEEGKMDSIKIVELVDKLETAFSVSISPMELEAKNFESVEAIEHLIERAKTD